MVTGLEANLENLIKDQLTSYRADWSLSKANQPINELGG